MRSILILVLLVSIGWTRLAYAQDAPTGDAQQSAYQESISQESVRKQADKIRAEIAELLSEAKLNGLDTTQLAALSEASANLATLSEGDMAKVVSALQSASSVTQAQARQQILVKAFEDQKSISLKLKALAVTLEAQESEKELPLRLQALVARQCINIRQTKALAASSDARQKSAHDVVSSEQSTIGGEIGLLAKALAGTPDLPATPGAFNLSKTILDAMSATSLISAAQAATDTTSTGAPADAVARQVTVRDDLITLLLASLSHTDANTRLDELKTQLHQIYSNQKDLAAMTSQEQTEAGSLADRQAQIGDSTLVMVALLKPVSAAAGSQAEVARQAMDDTSAALQTGGNPADSTAKQQVALDALKKAEDLLDRQIAAARQQQNVSPTDKLAELQELSQEIAQAQKNPAETAADLQKLQQDALAPSPSAAAKIGEAADQLAQPQPDAAGANNALALAQAALQQEEDAMKQAAQNYEALDQAKQELAQSQQQAAAANQALQQNNGSANAAAAHDLTQAQNGLAQMNQTPPPGGLPATAQQAMQQANNAMQTAANQAVQGQNANAQAQTQAAMNSMQQAQTALGQAMAQIQQQTQGGQGEAPGQAMAQGQGQPQAPGQLQPGQGKDGEAPVSGDALLGGSGAGGIGQVVGGLQPRDRDAIRQFQAEKSPPEYAPLVQQYLKNIADQKP